MASLAILIPLYPSLCVLFSSLLIVFLYRRSIRRACPRFLSRICLPIFRRIKTKTKNQNQKRGDYYTRLDDRDMELESGLESDLERGIQSEDDEDEEKEEDEDEEEAESTLHPSKQTTPISPLALYFNPHTTLIHPHLLSPAAPPTPRWERRLRRRIDEGHGLGAWKDRLVEGTVRWLRSFSA